MGNYLSERQKRNYAKLVDENNGSVSIAQDLLAKKGIKISTTTLRIYYKQYQAGTIQPDKVRKSVNLSPSHHTKFSVKEREIAVEIYKANNFDTKKTLDVLKQKGIDVSVATLRRWLKESGPALEENKFHDVASMVRNNLAVKYQDVEDLVWRVHEKTLNRLLDLIPEERNVVNLATILKVTSDHINAPKPNQEQPGSVSFIQQINQYIAANSDVIKNAKKNAKENRNAGYIKDVTPERK